MHNGICSALFLTLHVVGLVKVLIVYKNTLTDTVTKSDIKINKYLLMYWNYNVHITKVWQI